MPLAKQTRADQELTNECCGVNDKGIEKRGSGDYRKLM
jgi:hypothetical protein